MDEFKSPYIEYDDEKISGGTSAGKKLIEVTSKTTAPECAPHIAGSAVCSSAEALKKIKEWLHFPQSTDPKAAISEAKDKLGCESESCLYTKSPFVELKSELKRFNPTGPWNSTEWLSNDNIDDVLRLYTKKFPRFYHVKFQMRDFKKQGRELANLDWTEIIKKYDCMACVLNTDETGRPGEHWVCVFVDIKGRTVEYFDSAAQSPPQEFVDWVSDTAIQLADALGKAVKETIVTKVEHQQGDSECGVYCLYYIINRLNGVPFHVFEYRKIPDEDMVEFRGYLFRHS